MRNLYEELAEYTGRDKQVVMYKCANAVYFLQPDGNKIQLAIPTTY